MRMMGARAEAGILLIMADAVEEGPLLCLIRVIETKEMERY